MNQDENTTWQYKPDADGTTQQVAETDDSSNPPAKKSSSGSVAWEAVEYIDHPHGAGWYAVLVLATAALALLIYFVAKDKVATGTIVIVGLIVGVFAHQKPGQAQYEITDSGLSINGKIYPYASYKSFTIIPEGGLSSVNLFPLKRFMPPLSAYFDSKDEKQITQALGEYLPYDDRKLDSIERLSRRLRL